MGTEVGWLRKDGDGQKVTKDTNEEKTVVKGLGWGGDSDWGGRSTKAL